MTAAGSVETRPERALYNVGVAIRLIEGVLADLDRELDAPTGRENGRIVEHVVTALRLIERLDAPTGAAGGFTPDVRSELRGQLESVLTDLRRGATTPLVAG